MTPAVRRLLLPLVAAGLVLVGTGTAQAAYDSSASLPTTSVATLKVAPPTGLSTAGTQCVTTVDPTTGTTTTTLQAKVSWTASTTTRGVTGYVVSAVFSDGTRYPVTSTDASTTSVSGTYDAYYASQNISVVVTTTTSYGWTASTAPSSAVTC
jgi:hypothetical protein